MDNNNKILTVVLIALTAVAGGLAIIFSIGLAVQSATVPMTTYLREIAETQKRLENVLARTASDNAKAFESRIAALEGDVRSLKSMPQRPQGGQPAMPEEDLNKVYNLPVEDSFVLGPKDAPVTVVIFEDYQCPFCARFFPAVLDARKAFADKVRIVIKQFPLPMHQMAVPAAKAVMAAGEQGKAFEMMDLVFANMGSLSEEKFKELAGKAGLNVEKFSKDIKDNGPAYEKRIEADIKLGMNSDVRGTPTYFLNGKKTMARTAEQWKEQFEKLLKK